MILQVEVQGTDVCKSGEGWVAIQISLLSQDILTHPLHAHIHTLTHPHTHTHSLALTDSPVPLLDGTLCIWARRAAKPQQPCQCVPALKKRTTQKTHIKKIGRQHAGTPV